MSDDKVLNVGDTAPDFTLRTIGLKEVGLAEFRGKNVVILFYPLDWTPGSHDNWARSVGISHYPLLSDIHRAVSRDYGVYWPEWNANVRATFIVDKEGKIRFVERYGKGELPEPDKILSEIKKLR